MYLRSIIGGEIIPITTPPSTSVAGRGGPFGGPSLFLPTAPSFRE